MSVQYQLYTVLLLVECILLVVVVYVRVHRVLSSQCKLGLLYLDSLSNGTQWYVYSFSQVAALEQELARARATEAERLAAAEQFERLLRQAKGDLERARSELEDSHSITRAERLRGESFATELADAKRAHEGALARLEEVQRELESARIAERQVKACSEIVCFSPYMSALNSCLDNLVVNSNILCSNKV